MTDQSSHKNEDMNTNKGRRGSDTLKNDLGEEQRPEGGKNKSVKSNEGSHDEGQYQEGSDKATMSPGSSQAEVNPSADGSKSR